MAVENSLVKAQNKGTIQAYLNKEGVKSNLIQMFGDKEAQKFITSIATAVNTNADLAKCDYSTILSAAMLGVGLNLPPSPQLGYFYMIPFDERKNGQLIRTVATFVLGYKGYLQLAQRSGQYLDIDVFEIKEGEFLGRDKTTGKFQFSFIQDEDHRESLPTIGYMAYFEQLNGFRKTLYWSKSKMEAHALEYSKGYKKDKANGTSWTFWSKDFTGMAFKTMLRQLISKWGIMSVEMQTAFERDTAVERIDGVLEYPDNAHNEPTPSFMEAEITEVSAPTSEVSSEQMSLEDEFFGK